MATKKRKKKAARRAHKASDGSRSPDVLTRQSLLFDQTRLKWQSGDWQALGEVELSEIEGDSSRAALALMIAAAQSQVGSIRASQISLKQALAWGADRDLAARMMISAAENSLGCLAIALSDESAPAHFENAINLVDTGPDSALLARTRQIRELTRLGFLPEAVTAIEDQFDLIRDTPVEHALGWEMLASNLTVIKAEVRALEKRHMLYKASPENIRSRQSRSEIAPPFVVVVAGVPRSGSTWLYNAARLICEASELDLLACWVADYDKSAKQDADVHLIKLHNEDQLSFPYHRLLTTRRDLDERLASLLRIGWIESTPEAILNAAKGHASLHAYWAERSDLEISYDEIEHAPIAALEKICDVLDMPLSHSDKACISASLAALKAPEAASGPHAHDATTLLHPDHRSDKAARDNALHHVRKVLAKGRP